MDDRPPATAPVVDACLRLDVAWTVRAWRPVTRGLRVAGPAFPVRHAGSVDVFLEACLAAAPGSVLVIDNQGRDDEGCIGDLTFLETRHHGFAGIVVHGCHRDEAELRRLGAPVWSQGRVPNGPVAARERPPHALGSADLAGRVVSEDDFVIADDDGVVFLPAGDWPRVQEAALTIEATERDQAARIMAGVPLVDQLRFQDHLERRVQDPAHTFRDHLRRLGGEIEQ